MKYQSVSRIEMVPSVVMVILSIQGILSHIRISTKLHSLKKHRAQAICLYDPTQDFQKQSYH